MAKKQVCVIGLGQFGKEVALKLAREGAEVIAIDSKREAVDEIADEIDHSIVANVTDLRALKEAVPAEMDCVVVGIGSNIEASILCTHFLHQMGIKQIIAKASNEHHAIILKEVGAAQIVFPERDMAESVAEKILKPNFLNYLPLLSGFEVVEIACPKKFTGRSLIKLDLRKKYGVFILAVKRQDSSDAVFLPAADFELKETDVIIVVGKKENIDQL
jgi:trk system potassium uptake protein TrkA